MRSRSPEPAVAGEGPPGAVLSVPAQLDGSSPAIGEDGPFGRLAAVARTMLDAPVAFVARSRWPSRPSASPPGAMADAFCRIMPPGAAPLTVEDARTSDDPRLPTTSATAWLCRPILGPAGEALGMFCVLSMAARAWTARDGEIVASLARAAACELELRDNADRAARDARRLTELTTQSATLAHALQESLLPPHLPDVPGMQVAARYLSATDGLGVLGDFYDLFPGPRRRAPSARRWRGTAGERWDAVIGDVCGHGVDAATLASLARYTLRAVAARERSPARILGGLNAALLAQRPGSERFLTAVYVTLFPARGRVDAVIASAGHTPALVRDATGTVRVAGRHGLPLGLFDAPGLGDTRLSLAAGDTLLLYTDGVTEARRGGEQYGEERLRKLFADAGGLDAHHLAGAVEQAVLSFTGGQHTDDIAILALRVTGA
jgi:phosphoserine phosphatase RsbU/P